MCFLLLINLESRKKNEALCKYNIEESLRIYHIGVVFEENQVSGEPWNEYDPSTLFSYLPFPNCIYPTVEKNTKL